MQACQLQRPFECRAPDGRLQGAHALVVGSDGAGCAIDASLAATGVAALGLFDVNVSSANAPIYLPQSLVALR